LIHFTASILGAGGGRKKRAVILNTGCQEEKTGDSTGE